MALLKDSNFQIPPVLPPASAVDGQAPRGQVSFRPLPRGCSVRSGSVRTKPNRAVTIQLPCELDAFRSAQVVIESPPHHGVLKTVGLVYFEVPEEENDAAVAPRVPPVFRRYHPDPGFVGTDRFTFCIVDGDLRSETATVSITVSEENLAPVALPQTVKVKQGESIWIELGGVDEDNDPLQVQIVSWPTSGNLRVPTGADYFGACEEGEDEGIARPFPPLPRHYIYEPNPPLMEAAAEVVDVPFLDQFTFTVTDGELTSAPATVDVTVLPCNRPPVGMVSVPQAVSAWSKPGRVVVIARNTAAEVILDGSQSTDPDGDAIEIWWALLKPTNVFGISRTRFEESLVACGLQMVTTLALGQHTIVAHVSDGSLEDECRVAVNVISPVQAIDRLAADVRALRLAATVSKPLMEALKSARVKAKQEQFRLAATELGKFQCLWETLRNEQSACEFSPLTQTAESIILAIHPPVAIAPFLAQRLDAVVE